MMKNKIEFKAEDFPKKATKKNLRSLYGQGHRIEEAKPRKSTDILNFLDLFSFGCFVTSLTIFAILLGLFIYSLVLYSGNVGTGNASVILGSFFLALFLLLLVFLSLASVLFFKRIFKIVVLNKINYPRPRYEVFGFLSNIAECIAERNHGKAVGFLQRLDDATERYLMSKRSLKTSLAPYLMVLRSSQELEDLILYNEDKDLPLLLVDIGLAIVHDDYPKLRDFTDELRFRFSHRQTQSSRLETIFYYLQTYERPIMLIIKSVSAIAIPIAIIVLVALGIPVSKLL